MLNTLVSLLDLVDGDYWSDVASSEARSLIDQDPQKLLSEIFPFLNQWPENRLEHLAYILGEGDSPIEEEILIHLSTSIYPSVSLRARELLHYVRGKKCMA